MSENALQALRGRESPPPVTAAQIAGELASNSFTRKPMALNYYIELRLAHDKALLELGPLALQACSWEKLEGRDWRPGKPHTTYADGEALTAGLTHGRLTLGELHSDVICKSIRFGRLDGDRLPARLDVVVEESPPRLWQLDVEMEIGPIEVLGDIFTNVRPELATALELAQPYLDLSKFEPRVTNAVVVLRHAG